MHLRIGQTTLRVSSTNSASRKTKSESNKYQTKTNDQLFYQVFIDFLRIILVYPLQYCIPSIDIALLLIFKSILAINLNLAAMSQLTDFQLSIQLEENNSQKSREQQLEQFVELTRKIAQSDRNNDLLRQLRRNKSKEVNKVKSILRESQAERQVLETQSKRINGYVQEGREERRRVIQELASMGRKYDDNTIKQRQIEGKNTLILKENEKLQKKIASLQSGYESILRANKQKQSYLQQMKQKRDSQVELVAQNQKKIFQLQKRCQVTKRKAQQLQSQIKKQLIRSNQLKSIQSQKERQLQIQRKQKDESTRKSQDTKRSINKILSQVRTLQQQIDKKSRQIDRLTLIHTKLQKELERIESGQRALEDKIQKRREIVEKVRKANDRIKRDKDDHQEDVKNRQN